LVFQIDLERGLVDFHEIVMVEVLLAEPFLGLDHELHEFDLIDGVEHFVDVGFGGRSLLGVEGIHDAEGAADEQGKKQTVHFVEINWIRELSINLAEMHRLHVFE
jgi:hypothetical protein